MKKFKRSELTNSLLFEIFRRNFPDYKIYNKTEDGIEKVIVQKNGYAAVEVYVTNKEGEKFIELHICDTDSFFHTHVLPWILFLFALFPGVIWYIVYLRSAGKLYDECVDLVEKHLENV